VSASIYTSEPEITGPVDLCRPGGVLLDPRARGWSRRPLHRANLRGRWGRTKRWDYWAVLTDRWVVALVYADVDYLGLVEVSWIDLATGRRGGRQAAVPLGRGVDLPEIPGTEPLRFRGRHLGVDVDDGPDGTRLRATWTEPDHRIGRLDVTVAAPPGHESLNVVIPWSDRLFQFTSKHQARPATGVLDADGQRIGIGGDAGDAWGVLDVGRGRWPYRTRWNWAGGAGRAGSGAVVGLQMGGRWTVGTGYTENGVIVAGELVKIGEELDWGYDWDRPMAPWRVRGPQSGLDLTLTPRYDRHVRTNALVLSTEVHQVFGRWTGTVPSPGGGRLEVDGILGFAEESRSRW